MLRSDITDDLASAKLMLQASIPEVIRVMDRETIVKHLAWIEIEINIAVHRTAQVALRAALSQVGVKKLRYSVVPLRFYLGNEVALRFSVPKPDRFTFWKNESTPGSGFDLYVVPNYHPVLNDGKMTGMINGATDALVSGKAVYSIHCPKAAQTKRAGLFGSWSNVNHPFRVFGRSFAAKLITTRLRTKEGVDELADVLRGALGMDGRYISVSGGFQPPFEYPHNRIIRLRQPSPYPRASDGNSVRGSENHCVWGYRTLEKEGVLGQSYVPSWFLQEGWLKIYENAPSQPGIF